MAAPPSDRVQPAFLKNLLSHPGAQVEGNPHGNLTIFEFFDYRCLLCKAMQPELLALLAHDTRVRLVLKDWPLLGQDSVYAARVSIAAGWQGRYADVHDTLMAWRGPLGHEQTRALVKSAGVDMARLDRDMQDGGSKITMLLEKDAEEAHQLGIHATPGLVIGDEIVPGAVSAGDLNDIVQTTQAKL
jgi:protein-disulfide isomerase